MSKLKNIQADADTIEGMVAAIKAAIPSMQVKTASASPAGRKIQARITWREGGKTVLGYVSVYVPRHEPGKPVPPFPALQPRALVEQAYRVADRGRRACAGQQDSWQRASQIYQTVMDKLTEDPATLAPLQPLCDEVLKMMRAVHKAGGHHTTRRLHTQKKARAALASTLDYVLASGISDDEVKEMLKEALVRHTMES